MERAGQASPYRPPATPGLIIKRYKYRESYQCPKTQCRGGLVSPVLVDRIIWYREQYQYPQSQNKHIRVCDKGLYNFSSAQARSRSFRCERLHLPDLTWRQRAIVGLMQPIAQILIWMQLSVNLATKSKISA